MRHLTHLALLVVLGCGSSGCAYFAATPPLEAAPEETLVSKDTPVPAGFKLDTAASHRHERDGYRRLDLVYRRLEYLGEERAREFVQQAYEQAGWKAQFIWGLERSHFLYQRGAEECEVEIFEDFGDRFTELHLSVRPRETPDGGLVAGRRDETPRAETQRTLPASSPKRDK
ncbi:MAG: hypothetical protein AB7N76_35235 [Planctomycetota bacterium]